MPEFRLEVLAVILQVDPKVSTGWNSYAYAGNNGVMHSDRSGLVWNDGSASSMDGSCAPYDSSYWGPWNLIGSGGTSIDSGGNLISHCEDGTFTVNDPVFPPGGGGWGGGGGGGGGGGSGGGSGSGELPPSSGTSNYCVDHWGYADRACRLCDIDIATEIPFVDPCDPSPDPRPVAPPPGHALASAAQQIPDSQLAQAIDSFDPECDQKQCQDAINAFQDCYAQSRIEGGCQ